MRSQQIGSRQVRAGRAHRLAIAIAVNGVDLVVLAVHEQNRPQNLAAVWRAARVGNVGRVVQVPRARWAKAMGIEGID